MNNFVCSHCNANIETVAGSSKPFIKCTSCGKHFKADSDMTVPAKPSTSKTEHAAHKSKAISTADESPKPAPNANHTISKMHTPAGSASKPPALPKVPRSKQIDPYSGFIHTFLWFNRIGRFKFLLCMILAIIGYLILNDVYRPRGIIQSILLDNTAILYFLPVAYLALIGLVKRLHDIGHKGILAFVAIGSLFIVDLIFLVIIVPLLVRSGVPDANEYGLPPA